MASLPELFTVDEVAAALKLRPKTVRGMAARGAIRYRRLNGSGLRFTAEDVTRYLAKQPTNDRNRLP